MKEPNENYYKIALGKNIRRIRKKRNMTQDAFAEKIDIESPNLSNIENGKSFPSTLTIIKLQKYFQISYDEIFNMEYHKDIKDIEQDIQNSLAKATDEKKRQLWQIIQSLDF